MSAFSRFTPLIGTLPSTVPFVGPEALERQRGLPVKARIGANENGFGPAPSVLAAMRERPAISGNTTIRRILPSSRRLPRISA